MLDPEFKKQWLAALRSGDIEQGKGFLQIGNKFCCLGVACKLVGELTFIPPGAVAVEAAVADVADSAALAETAREKGIGKTRSGGICMWTPPGLTPNHSCHLALMNDQGKTFLEIADYIEANF